MAIPVRLVPIPVQRAYTNSLSLRSLYSAYPKVKPENVNDVYINTVLNNFLFILILVDDIYFSIEFTQ